MKRKIRQAVVPQKSVWLVEGSGCIFDTKERAERFVEWLERKEAERAANKPEQWVELRLVPGEPKPERDEYDQSVPDHWDS